MGLLCDWQIERDITITPFSPAQKRPGVISYGLSSSGYDARLGYKLKMFKPYPPGGAAHVIDPKNFDPRMLEDVDLTPPTAHDWVETAADGKMMKCSRCHVNRDNPHHANWLKECVKHVKSDHIIIPPNSFALGESLEEFQFPRDITCIVLGKSTLARCGLIVNVTPGEPDWQGRWTIELSNTTPLPMKVYVGEGIMQCLFLRSDARYELAIGALADYLQLPGAPQNGDEAPPTREEAANYLRQLVLREGPIFKEATCTQSYADKKGKYQGQGGLTLPEVDKVAPQLTEGGDVVLYGQPMAGKTRTTFEIRDGVTVSIEDPTNIRPAPTIEGKTAAVNFKDFILGPELRPGPVTGSEAALFHEAEKARLSQMRVTFAETVIEPTVEKIFPGTPFSVHYNSLPAAAPAATPPATTQRITAPTPPPDAKGDFWKSPDGSIWRRKSPDSPWVQVSEPVGKMPGRFA